MQKKFLGAIRLSQKVFLTKNVFQMVILSDPRGGKGGDHLRKKRNNDRQYVFDVAFGADSSQQEVYEKTTRPLVTV